MIAVEILLLRLEGPTSTVLILSNYSVSLDQYIVSEFQALCASWDRSPQSDRGWGQGTRLGPPGPKNMDSAQSSLVLISDGHL